MKFMWKSKQEWQEIPEVASPCGGRDRRKGLLYMKVYPEVWIIKPDVIGSFVGDKLRKIVKLIVYNSETSTS